MLELDNRTPFPAALVPGTNQEGTDTLTVVAKGTFAIGPGIETPPVADEQVPLVWADEFRGEPDASSILYEADTAPFKPATDIVVIASAHPERGRRAYSVDVALRVADLSRTIRVYGDRRWYRSQGFWRMSDPEPFRSSLALTPEYLHSDEQDSTDLMDFGLPLGRRFRALKLWFLLRWHGADGLRERLRHHIEWARGFADRVEDDPRFELVAPPSFSTVVFRALPAPGEGTGGDADEEGRESSRPLERGEGVDTLAANELNRNLLDRVNREGGVFLSHTELAGTYVLRLSVGAYEALECGA